MMKYVKKMRQITTGDNINYVFTLFPLSIELVITSQLVIAN